MTYLGNNITNTLCLYCNTGCCIGFCSHTARFILLVLNLLLLPVFFRRKEDLLTPLLAVLAAILSFFYISSTLPIVSTPVPATLSLTWSDNAKIDGGRLKGFAKTSTGETIYAVYKFK